MRNSLVDCTDCADLVAVSTLYSQLAGVLAGFAFAGIIGLITYRAADAPRIMRGVGSLPPMMAAFIGLVISSLNYALVTGDESRTMRVADLQFASGFGFSVAGLMLLYSIHILFRGMSTGAVRDPDARGSAITGHVVAWGGWLLVPLLYGGYRDHLDARFGRWDATGLRSADIASWAIITASLAFTVLVSLRPPQARSSDRLVRRLAGVSVAFALISLTSVNAIIMLRSRREAIPEAVPLVGILVLGLLHAFVLYSSLTYTREDTRRAARRSPDSAAGNDPPQPGR